MLAFAITIHKAQGLSLQSAIIDAGKPCLGSGMIYVALSRVTSLAGLHLVDLDKSRIKCDKKAISEYNRLRQKYRPHLGEMASTELCRKRKQEHTSDQPPTKRPTTQPSDNNMQPTASVFEHVNIDSLTEMTQSSICRQLNLQLFPNVKQMQASSPATAKHLNCVICKQTNSQPLTKVYRISGSDGDCLFRALSLGVTGSQVQHHLLRGYIVSHMLDGAIKDELQKLYARSAEEYRKHVDRMCIPGEWGTDAEIAAAAHLLNVSILCFSKHSAHGDYQL